MQIQQVVLEEYQANLAFHSPMWFIIFKKLPNRATYHKNIAKLLTQPGIWGNLFFLVILIICILWIFLEKKKLLNTLTASLQRVKTPYPTYKYLQYTEQSNAEAPVIMDLWECGVPLHCHHSQVLSDPEC